MTYIYHDKLESERLVTRFLTPEDVAIWAEFFRDRESIEFLPAFNVTSEEERSRFWVEKQLKRYAAETFGLQALISKQSGEFVGQCGLLIQELDGVTEVEVGYHILKNYRGQAYAPEAARLFINYAFDNRLTDSVVSIIHEKNEKSKKVAGKNGLVLEKTSKWAGLDACIYRVSREKWYSAP
jgi:[ribosomal protein S5]-alanine N-acetyltransferase